MAKQRFIASAMSVAVTVSVGVASLSELGSSVSLPSDLVSLADDRLYDAKRAGGNRVDAGSSRARLSPDALQA